MYKRQGRAAGAGAPSRTAPVSAAPPFRAGPRRLRLPYFWDAMARSARGLVSAYLLGGQQGLWRQAERVLAPTLLVYGGRDQLVGFRMARRSARAFRDCRLVTLPDAGHVAMMEYPGTVALAFRELLADATESVVEGDTGVPGAQGAPGPPAGTGGGTTAENLRG